MDREFMGLVFALAELSAQANKHSPGVRALIDRIQDQVGPDGGLNRELIPSLLQQIDRLSVELEVSTPAPRTGPLPSVAGAGPGAAPAGLEALLRRVSDAYRALVPLADPEGVERDTVLPALSALASATRVDACDAHLDTLATFAASRRKLVAGELMAVKQGQRKLVEVLSLTDSLMEFIGKILSDVPEFEVILSVNRERLSKAEAKGVSEIRVELASHLHRYQGTAAPVHEQKSVIKSVLRTLADQLALAAAGSEAFERSAQEIRRRVEAANDLSELKQLQDLLVREAGTAASDASRMRGQLGALSTQVNSSQQQIDTLERALVETKQAMNLDPLTRVPNHRAMNDWVEATLYPPGRAERAFSLLVLDLDHFKRVNDTHGHLGGDVVLAETAKRVKLGIRDVDMLARYGGEEFVLILPDCDLNVARAVAERMCSLVARKPIVYETANVQQTTSIGVATKRPGETFKEVFERADQCVYLAKEAGRNRAVTETSLPPPAAT